MVEVLRTAHPKARKRHCCQLCLRTIPAGTVYDRQTVVCDDEIGDFVSHVECTARLGSDVYDDDIGGYPEGCLAEHDVEWMEHARATWPAWERPGTGEEGKST